MHKGGMRMVTVEISTGLLVVLLLSGIIFLMMEYWFARCDVRRYQQWYEDMCHNWNREMRENIKLKEQLYQREEEGDRINDK
jgi:hypothetical protein